MGLGALFQMKAADPQFVTGVLDAPAGTLELQGDVFTVVQAFAGKPCAVGVLHVCNNVGAWGKGFVLAVNQLSPLPKQKYVEDHRAGKLALGSWRIVPTHDVFHVVNIVAQKGLPSKDNPVPFSQKHFDEAISEIAGNAQRFSEANNTPFVFVAPTLGAGLARGNWGTIKSTLSQRINEAGHQLIICHL